MHENALRDPAVRFFPRQLEETSKSRRSNHTAAYVLREIGQFFANANQKSTICAGGTSSGCRLETSQYQPFATSWRLESQLARQALATVSEPMKSGSFVPFRISRVAGVMILVAVWLASLTLEWYAFFFTMQVPFYIIGLVLLGYGLRMMKRSTEPASWPTTQGRIVSCELVKDSDGKYETYEVKASYSYSVRGVNFTNDKLAFGYEGTIEQNAQQQILTKLEEARTVDVRYDPMAPQNSVLTYGIRIQSALVFALAWLAFQFGLTVAVCLMLSSDNVLLQNLITH